MKGQLGTKGRWYTIDGVKVAPKYFASRSAFKILNRIIWWAKTGNKNALKQAEYWIEKRGLELGINKFRVWYDYTFWLKEKSRTVSASVKQMESQMALMSTATHALTATQKKKEDFWATPRNYSDVIDLRQVPGRTFRLSKVERRVLSKMARLGTKHGIFWDVAFLATIKHFERGFGDPRGSQLEANIWNGHYLVAVGKFIARLRKRFGYVPFQCEIANEFNTVHPAFNTKQIGDMCARFQKRDAQELIGIDQAGPPVDWHHNEVPYIPILKDGARSPCDIRLHPARDIELPWWDIGKYIDKYFKKYRMPIYVDEPIYLMPRAAYDNLPKGHPWRSIGTKNKKRYGEMMEDLWSRGIYTCFHDGGNDNGSTHGGGVSGGWIPKGIEDKPGSVDAFIKELLS